MRQQKYHVQVSNDSASELKATEVWRNAETQLAPQDHAKLY